LQNNQIWVLTLPTGELGEVQLHRRGEVPDVIYQEFLNQRARDMSLTQYEYAGYTLFLTTLPTPQELAIINACRELVSARKQFSAFQFTHHDEVPAADFVDAKDRAEDAYYKLLILIDDLT